MIMDATETNDRINELRKQQCEIETEIKSLLKKNLDSFSVYLHAEGVHESLSDEFRNISDDVIATMSDTAKSYLYEIECVFKCNELSGKHFLEKIITSNGLVFVNSDNIESF